jgi:hypothetical protein
MVYFDCKFTVFSVIMQEKCVKNIILFGFLLTYSYLCSRFHEKAHRVMVN